MDSSISAVFRKDSLIDIVDDGWLSDKLAEDDLEVPVNLFALGAASALANTSGSHLLGGVGAEEDEFDNLLGAQNSLMGGLGAHSEEWKELSLHLFNDKTSSAEPDEDSDL